MLFNPLVHIIFVVIGFAFFLWQYIKFRYVYQLILLIWIPLTLTQYISPDKTYLSILGVVQMLLFIVFVFFLFKKNTQNKRDISKQLEQQNNQTEEFTIEEDKLN